MEIKKKHPAPEGVGSMPAIVDDHHHRYRIMRDLFPSLTVTVELEIKERNL